MLHNRYHKARLCFSVRSRGCGAEISQSFLQRPTDSAETNGGLTAFKLPLTVFVFQNTKCKKKRKDSLKEKTDAAWRDTVTGV